VRLWWVAALLAVGVAGCGGHARAATRAHCATVVPTDLEAPGPYPVRRAHVVLTRRATTSAELRHIDPTAWFPAPGRPGCRHPLILFSHGANGKPTDDGPLLAHLASQGFVVLAPLHPDRGAQGDEPAERVADVTYLLDHLRAVARRLSPGLAGELDARRVGIAGHSFGAFTASSEAVGEPRIRAALAMAGPLRPGNAGSTRVPVLAMTGSADNLVPSRLVRAYYDRLPASVPHGYLRIAGGNHYAYGTRCTAERTCGIVDAYASSFFLTCLAGERRAGRLLEPHAPRLARARLQTVRMP
jgi:dienelactone hydrolase